MLCPSCSAETHRGATFCERCGTRLATATEGAPDQNLSTSHGFVGRKRELGELMSALDGALAGAVVGV